MAVEWKRVMEEKIKRLNIGGAELLISQIKELQGRESVYEIVNGAVIPAREVDEYKIKYEKAVKERDLLLLKIKNLASAASSSLVLLGIDTNTDPSDPPSNNHPQETPTLNPGNSALQTTPVSRHGQSTPSVPAVNHTTPVSRHGQSTPSVPAVNHTSHHPTQTTSSSSSTLLSIPSYSQTLQPAFHGWQVM